MIDELCGTSVRGQRHGKLSLKIAQVGGGEGGDMSISVVGPEVIDARERVIAVSLAVHFNWRR